LRPLLDHGASASDAGEGDFAVNHLTSSALLQASPSLLLKLLNLRKQPSLALL
jgi:hypothetical protein